MSQGPPQAENQPLISQTLLRACVVYLISFSHLHGRCASKLTAFGKVTCKGKVACGIASQGLSNNQKDLEGGGTLFSWGQKDRSCLPWQTITWFHDCTAGTKGLELKGFQGKGILTTTFYSLAQFW